MYTHAHTQKIHKQTNTNTYASTPGEKLSLGAEKKQNVALWSKLSTFGILSAEERHDLVIPRAKREMEDLGNGNTTRNLIKLFVLLYLFF